jgi:hypothetical protein
MTDQTSGPAVVARTSMSRHRHRARLVAAFADWPTTPAAGLVPEFAHIPPRPPEDVLPRGGRNPRIFCERHDSGTWIHGDPHNCPTWARR